MTAMLWLVAPVLAGDPAPFAGAAPTVEVWAQTDFGQNVLLGTGGWTNGYPADPWRGGWGAAEPLTDQGDTGYGFGEGSALDNWLIRGPRVGQGAVDVAIASYDDDAVGVVFAHDGVATGYIAGWSAGAAPPPVEIVGPTAFLLKVVDGEVVSNRTTPVPGPPARLSLEVDDGHLQVQVDGVTAIGFEDADPLPPGLAGFYAYQAGAYQAFDGAVWFGYDATPVYFDDIWVIAFDEDGDGIVDDRDPCESIAGPCAPDPDPTATGGTDATARGDDVDRSGTVGRGGGVGCGCDAASGAVAAWALVALAAVASVRRSGSATGTGTGRFDRA
jgi:uncharacterized protein (TIGR03382 family)